MFDLVCGSFTPQEWLNSGIAATVLMAMLWMIWHAGAWMGPNFIVPIRDAAIHHLSKIEQVQDTMIDLMRDNTRVIQQLEKVTDKTAYTLDLQTEKLKEIHNSIEEIHKESGRYFSEEHEERNKDRQ